MTELELATLPDLWEEIIKRTKAAVLIVMMEPKEKSAEASAATYLFHGGYQTAVGLTTWAQSRLLSPGGDEEDEEE